MPNTPAAPNASGRPASDALVLEHVAKRFGPTVALRDASLRLRAGTVHALLGENGAGKSTLVNIAFGHLRPDAGTLRVHGRPLALSSPADATAAGIGMVHQHFLLVPAMTVAENVALGRRGRLDLRRVAREIADVGTATGLRVDPAARVGELDVAAQQRVEIVKALVRGARILILDEPTAVLAPAEAVELLAWVRRFVDGGGSAVLITHKLREALAYAADVTVLRHGATTLAAPAASVTEAELLRAMLGAEDEWEEPRAQTRGAADGSASSADERVMAAEIGVADDAGPGRAATSTRAITTGGRAIVPDADAAPGAPPRQHDRPAVPAAHHPSSAIAIESPPVVLRLDHAAYHDDRGVPRLRDVTLAVRAGEILGVAGVEGAGHHELLRVLAGRLRATSGEVHRPAVVAFIPEDRHRDALLLDHSLTENVALRGAGERRGRVRWTDMRARTAAILRELDVRAAGPAVRAATLSGGNQQKLVLGRELWDGPPAVVAESPTRGLDVRAAASVLARLRAARDHGAAVVVYSSDLDELLAIADRVVAVHAGRVRETEPTRDALGRAIVGAA
ncbi:MAG TPA: ATP-binding cassette domain-containing protein [Gemmatimonadaceae bacterium]|nr:ATP-binding cassette domain-containing protein [Gemmatimonadaceae bacterium]